MRMKRSRKPSRPARMDRREFLAGAALGSVTAVSAMGAPSIAVAQDSNERTPPPPPNQAAEQGVPAEVQAAKPARGAPAAVALPGSDYMVDVIRSLGIEYIAFIPGDTFKGLHESIINYGMLTAPKLQPIACMHEEVSVALCHGYAKTAGKPMACMMHSTVGLQHGSMALYNAWSDRVPVFAIVGHQADADRRVGPVQWQHAVYDGPELVRDFTKFDDTPVTLADFADSAVRAYKLSMTPPYEPVLLALDEDLQEDPAAGGGFVSHGTNLTRPSVVHQANPARAGGRRTGNLGGAWASRGPRTWIPSSIERSSWRGASAPPTCTSSRGSRRSCASRASCGRSATCRRCRANSCTAWGCRCSTI